MNRIHAPDRESRFEDACKFAAAVVVVGLIVVAGEAAMQRAPSLGEAAMPAAAASDATAVDYFPDGYVLDAREPDEHVQAF